MSLVVDADIARASGTSEHPVSSGSRALLDNIQQYGHSVVMCKQLKEEWNEHRSFYAKKWLASMIARKKVRMVKPEQHAASWIDANIGDERDIGIAKKDSHLIDSALFADRFIASNDSTARRVFCALSGSCGQIRCIKWFNAVSDKDFLSTYLEEQCFVPDEYYVKQPA